MRCGRWTNSPAPPPSFPLAIVRVLLAKVKLPRLALRPLPWSVAFGIWFITLWLLSGRPAVNPPLPMDFPTDKVLHFGYFFGGAGLLSAALLLQRRLLISWSSLHLIVICLLFFTGALDEWHQSWYPFRTGNDAGDLSADFCGALIGTFVFRMVQPLVFPQFPAKP